MFDRIHVITGITKPLFAAIITEMYELTEPILILGHGQLYEESSKYQCCRIPPKFWLDKKYVSVDCDPEVRPTFVANLCKSPWIFATDQSFGTIIDASGTAIWRLCDECYPDDFIQEVLRILKKDGKFYGFPLTDKPSKERQLWLEETYKK